MSIAYSFAASFRWTPRYDFGEVAAMSFSLPEVAMDYDPFFMVEASAMVFPTTSMQLQSVIVRLDEIASEDTAMSFLPSNAIELQSVIKSIGNIASEDASISFLPSNTMDLKEVLNPVGPVVPTSGEEDVAVAFITPTLLDCFPP